MKRYYGSFSEDEWRAATRDRMGQCGLAVPKHMVLRSGARARARAPRAAAALAVLAAALAARARGPSSR